MDGIILLLILAITVIALLIDKVRGSTTSVRTFYHLPQSDSGDDILPNGFRRSDYREFGLTDFDIEYWGLDQPNAPEPLLSGLIIWDLFVGDFDGDID